jgi:hypothetical protein
MKNVKMGKHKEKPPEKIKDKKAYIWPTDGSYSMRKYIDGIPESETSLLFTSLTSEMLGSYLGSLKSKLKSEGYSIFGCCPPSP